MKKVYKTVLLDADNTLFDFDEAERQALDVTLRERGILPTEEIRARYLAINRPLWEALHRQELEQDWLVVERFRRLGEELGLRCDPAEWNREYLEALGACPALLPGARGLLEALAPHCVLALATNGVAKVQRARLANSPITPFFQGIFISQEIGAAKPDRGFFDHILAALGADRQDTVMIGDTLSSDIQGAINAGVDSIWYSRNHEKSDLPTYRVTTLEEIPELVLGGGRR